MKLSPSTIAANLSAAAAAEAEAAACTNSTMISGVGSGTLTNTTTISGSAVIAPPVVTTHSATMNNNANTTSTNVSKVSPKDSQVVAAILKEMGIAEYEPRVLPQVVEFAYRYASRVLEDAQLFSSYAKKKMIDSDDVNFAIQMNGERSFLGPPSRDTILEIARNKNAQPLPAIKSHNGMRLPADRYSLVAPNMRLVSNNKNSKNSTKTGTSLLSSTPNKTPSTGHKSNAHSFANLNSDSPGPKRKFDEAS